MDALGWSMVVAIAVWAFVCYVILPRLRLDQRQPPLPPDLEPDPLADADDWLSEQIAEADRKRRYDEAVARDDLVAAAAVELERMPPLSDEPGRVIEFRRRT